MARPLTMLLAAALYATGAFGCAQCAAEPRDEALDRSGAPPVAGEGDSVAPPLPAEVEAMEAETPDAGAARAARACGVCYAHNWQDQGARGYGSETSAASLRELRDVGIDALSYTDFGWMQGLSSTSIRSSTSMPGAETMERLRTDIAAAHALGMQTMVKPHIWIGRGAWRGDIAPAGGDWAAWFASYRDFILPRAAFAESVGAQWFVVGVEFVSATRDHEAQWRSLIAEVRAVYSGQVTYAANWDEVEQIGFWDALDAVGVQMFAPLLSADEPVSELAMVAGATRWLATYEAIAERVGRPLILTEAGVLNSEEGARQPWVWPEASNRLATAIGDEEQAMYYRAIAQTFGASERVVRIYWWKWFTNPDTNEEGPVGFSPRGKPAEQVLRELCGAQ